MVVATERGRDAINARPHDTEKRGFSMHDQFTTSLSFGDPQLPTRFWAKVEPKPSGCWLWMGGTNGRGYGRFRFAGRQYQAHRLAYERLIAVIPIGQEPDHLCRVPLCVNPTHLESVTHLVNLMRGDGFAARNRRKGQCPRGHPYSASNTYHTPRGTRECKTCRKERRPGWLTSLMR